MCVCIHILFFLNQGGFLLFYLILIINRPVDYWLVIHF